MQALFQSAQHLNEKREGSESIPLTNGFGSGRPKNMRIRIPNAVFIDRSDGAVLRAVPLRPLLRNHHVHQQGLHHPQGETLTGDPLFFLNIGLRAYVFVFFQKKGAAPQPSELGSTEKPAHSENPNEQVFKFTTILHLQFFRFNHLLSVILFSTVYNCHFSAITGIFFNPEKI